MVPCRASLILSDDGILVIVMEFSPEPRKLSYHQIRAFNAVMKEGNFSRAATALGITQPAITAQIRALEDAFGVTLFDRGGAVARPTRLAIQFFRETDQINDIEQIAADLLSSSYALKTGELSIVSGAPNLAMAAIAEYKRRYPNVRIITSFGSWADVTATIFERRADVAILTCGPEDERLIRRPYAKQKIAALVASDNPLAQRNAISLGDLAERPLIFRTTTSLTQSTLIQAFKTSGLVMPEPIMTVESREAVLEGVKAGLGIGFAFSRASSLFDNVCQISIKGTPRPLLGRRVLLEVAVSPTGRARAFRCDR